MHELAQFKRVSSEHQVVLQDIVSASIRAGNFALAERAVGLDLRAHLLNEEFSQLGLTPDVQWASLLSYLQALSRSIQCEDLTPDSQM